MMQFRHERNSRRTTGWYWGRTAGHTVRTQHGVTASAGQRRGDVEIRNYLRDQAGSRSLVFDLSIAHDRFGSSSGPSTIQSCALNSFVAKLHHHGDLVNVDSTDGLPEDPDRAARPRAAQPCPASLRCGSTASPRRRRRCSRPKCTSPMGSGGHARCCVRTGAGVASCGLSRNNVRTTVLLGTWWCLYRPMHAAAPRILRHRMYRTLHSPTAHTHTHCARSTTARLRSVRRRTRGSTLSLRGSCSWRA